MLLETIAVARFGMSVYQAFIQPQQEQQTHDASPGGDRRGVVNYATLALAGYNALRSSRSADELRQARQEMNVHLDQVSAALEQQAKSIDVLSHGLDALRAEMRSGFAEVRGMIEDQNAREFDDRTQRLLQTYRRFLRILPDDDEARPLIDSAEGVERWCRRELRAVPPGSIGRLPYIAGAVFALRANADACIALGGPYERIATEHIEAIQSLLIDEARALIESRSLYEIAVDDHELLGCYMALLRSARGAAPDQWDDGLSPVRGAFAERGRKALPLRTLPDYAWYVAWSGQDPETFELADVREVSIAQLLPALGAPDSARLIGGTEGTAAARWLAALKIDDLLEKIDAELGLPPGEAPRPALCATRPPEGLKAEEWAEAQQATFKIPQEVSADLGGTWTLLVRREDGEVALRDPHGQLCAAEVVDDRRSSAGSFTVVPADPDVPFKLVHAFETRPSIKIVSTSYRARLG